jgi:hypothetical protein
VELGVRFTSDVAGQLTALRFYKGPGNTGPHVGHLWSATGTLLGTVSFTTETATGWQEAAFPTPIPLSANTPYLASYFAPVGRYAVDDGYFTLPRVAAPLQAPASSASAGNGVYVYSATGGFPTQTYQASNYWVDVVVTTAPPAGVRGDVDGNGLVTLADLRLLIRMLVGQVPPDLTTGDLDGNGSLGLGDVRALIRVLVGG